MEHKGTTAVIPAARGADNPALLTVLFATVNQTKPPTRILVLDMQSMVREVRLDENQQLVRFCDHFHIEVIPGQLTSTALALNYLIEEQANTEWVWIIPDDLAPAYDCHQKLLGAALQWDADLVSGVKLEVVRREPWGEDWNRMNHPHRGTIVMPWADTANLLVRRQVWIESDTSFDPGEEMNGEDVVTTAQIAQEHTIVGCGEAIGFHLPADEHRWTTQDGDAYSLKILSEKLGKRHFDWFNRFIKRS